MRTAAFGARGPAVPIIGQGTWNAEQAPEKAGKALLRGLELGLTHLDTAEMYGSGEVERLLGKVLAGRREQLFLVSKVLPGNASRAGVVAACERSLARLGTDHLDCYLLHWPSHHPLAETFAGFEALVAAGKILRFGVSNFDVPLLAQAVDLVGAAAIACNQVLYHLEERGIEHEVLPWCLARGIALVGYSPFGQGRFPSPRSAGGKVLAAIAGRHGATPHQVALAFLTRHEGSFAIPMSSNPRHVEENAGTDRVTLTALDLAELERAFWLGPPPRQLPTA
jgi:diketogulonate reductase-like aldo/keto reductase